MLIRNASGLAQTTPASSRTWVTLAGATFQLQAAGQFGHSRRAAVLPCCLLLISSSMAVFPATAAGQQPPFSSQQASSSQQATSNQQASGREASDSQAAERITVEVALDAEIRQHIENLGNPSYAVRVRARYELERMGLMAMDAIRAASESPDTEIAFAARYLLSSLNVRWARESDPAEVRQILLSYEDLNADDRKSRMDRLANLPDHLGSVALVRLARFEQNLQLSRWAALLAMRVETDQAALTPRSQLQIKETLGDSQRTSIRWLRQYMSELEPASYDAATWRELIAEERRLIEDAAATGEATAPILLELYRVSASRALELGDRSEALSLALDGLDNIMSRHRDLLDAVSWALDTELHEVVLELQRREPARFADRAELMYGVAEAYLIQGKQAEAEASRLSALQIGALPEPDDASDSSAEEKVSANELDRLAMRHRELASVLQTRGLFAWAEGEYRHVIERLPISSLAAALNRLDLAELLAYDDRHQEIVELLEPLVDRMNKDSSFRQRLKSSNAATLASQLEYHRGLALAGEAAQQALRQALQKDRDNPDILIAMFELDGDNAWQAEVRTEIARVGDIFLRQIRNWENDLKAAPQDQRLRLNLAIVCNQYAWLICSTTGDQANALRLSIRSNELLPEDSACLDTLAKCYYANEQIEQAIYHQRKAVRVDPHLPPLQRQLQFYLNQQKNAETPQKPAAQEPNSRQEAP
ncbi:hypothetical protein SH139x_003659 [Planctomycetaceae bacterium SH139]